MNKFFLKHHLTIILFAGLLFRVLFYFFGAKIYYGKNDFFVGGDTWGWVASIQNLIDHGTYTIIVGEPNGYFFRPPGYSFFIGIFYLLSGKNIDLTYQLVIYAQIFLDVAAIWLIYNIVLKFSENKIWAALSALLYTFYPFIIVWTPVVYAESSSVFFVLMGLWIFANEKIRYNYFWSGLFFGFAALFRLQIVFFFPSILFAITINYWNNIYALLKKALPFTLAFILSYGLWPVRNLIFHDRLLFTQDLSTMDCWDVDYMGFMDYIFSVKTDYEPQYSQIIKGGQNVVWPKASYLIPGDSAKLARVTKMCHDCGRGFNIFIKNEGFAPTLITNENTCSPEIAQMWSELKENQVNYNPLNYFLFVPLTNLKKSLLKTGLYNPANKIVNFVSTILFSYRSLMLFIGFFGLILYWRFNKRFPMALKITLFYFVSWYFWNCFVYRNMEIRYLIQADLLILIPAAYAILYFAEIVTKRKFLTP